MTDRPFDLVVRGGTIVTAEGRERADLGVRDGRIAQIGGAPVGLREIDAAERFVLPGGVDPHVHLNVEHLDPDRLRAFERVLFECARPRTVVLTTPNVEYNVNFPDLPAGRLRHRDHRFEWTRAEFQSWATAVATRFGYAVRFLPVGAVDPQVGAPTQMGIFHHD